MSATTLRQQAAQTAGTFGRKLRRSTLMIGGVLLVAMPLTSPAMAQDDAARLRKLEAEVKALQRKVFPGGSDRYFEPEIVAPQAQPIGPASTSGPVTDLLARMDAVESALQTLTSQVEINSNVLRLMNSRVEALEADAKAARDSGMLDGSAGMTGATGNNLSAMGAANTPRTGSGTPTPGPAPTPTPMSASSANAATGAPMAVEKPSTGDDADDTYVYGYRLWEAKKYAAAREQLQKVVNVYPNHRRASWARNLIGRSWLDQGEAKRAGQAFVDNYVTQPGGERAPDSLLYLAKATLALGDKGKSCEALAELRAAYPSEATGRLSALTSQTAREAGCN